MKFKVLLSLCCFLSIVSPVLSGQEFSAEQLRMPGKKGIGDSLPLTDNLKLPGKRGGSFTLRAPGSKQAVPGRIISRIWRS